MVIFKKVSQLEVFVENRRNAGKKTGFVPTMGALHQGHISLIETSIRENDLTISSIFVNPTQFNNPTDFEKYPITVEADINKLEQAGCDILLLPDVDEIYFKGAQLPFYDLGYLETILEGEFRPGHYQGVCQVVDRLLNIVKPSALYLGQKDYQQCMVIKKMVELQKIDVSIHVEKTIREKDGLAMSSRNARLNETERKQAVKIFEALSMVKKGIRQGSLKDIKQKAEEFLTANGFKVDYVEIADPDNLQAVDEWDGKRKLVVLVAAYLNEVRLIDNLVVE